MPRDSSGTYSLPNGTLVNTGDTVLVSQHNPPFQDVAQAITNSLDRDGKGGMRANLAMGGNRAVNMANGIDPTDAVTMQQLTAVTGVPLGIPLDYWGTVPPSGYMFCAGQELSRTTYAALFAVIGTNAGAGNGSTTFNLPDYRGRVSAGRDDMNGTVAGRLTTAGSGVNGIALGASGGAQNVTLTEAQMPAHTHTVTGSTNTTGAHTHSYTGAEFDLGGTGGGATANPVDLTTGSAGSHSHTVSGTAAATGGGQAHNNVQPTLVCNKIMRVQ